MTNYWENHYLAGGTSGDGKIDASRNWKMKILFDNGFRQDKNIIDVGCGDMVFWEKLHLRDYTGIDISCYQINKNQKKYPEYKFHCISSGYYLDMPKADIVTCFDMLFHIIREDDYINTLKNLTKYSENKIFVYTWTRNPFESFINRLIIRKPFERNVVTDDRYQYYRDFDAYSKKYIETEFKLTDVYTHKEWKYGGMYCYKIKED